MKKVLERNRWRRKRVVKKTSYTPVDRSKFSFKISICVEGDCVLSTGFDVPVQ
jgi:hypothetical protein